MNKTISVSIIIPTFNNEISIKNLVEELLTEFKKFRTEIIVINDGSTDQTEIVMSKLAYKYDEITFLQLETNCGEQNSVLAGLYYSKNDYILIMDDDFQHTPETALLLVNKCIENSNDVMYASFKQKKHSFLRNFGSQIFNKLMLFDQKSKKINYLSSFKCFKKEIKNLLLQKKDKFFNIDSLLMKLANNIGNIEVLHHKRKYGKSNYNFYMLMKLFFNSIFQKYKSLTFFLYYFSILGLITLFYYIIKIFYKNINNADLPLGYSTVVIFLAFISIMSIIQFIMSIGNISNKNQLIKIKYVISNKEKQ